jgi:TRAP transporter 4TM/12TM fusion protein
MPPVENRDSEAKNNQNKTKSRLEQRNPEGIWKVVLSVVAVTFVLFHIYTGFAGPLPNLEQRAVHVGFALILTFSLMRPSRKKGAGSWYSVFLGIDIIFIIMTIISCGYILFNYNWIMEHAAESTNIQLFLGTVALILALEAGRRTIGITFPILTLLFLLYALFGQYIPDIPLIGDYLSYWGHRGFSMKHIIQVMYLSDKGLWGFVTGVSSTIVAIFIIFGGFLLSTGAGDTFMDLAARLTGKFLGGAAKVSVVVSAFFGMLSGSAVANTATTGNFTIPLMKRLKYGNEFAAGVEATASAGGQITPPIMGSAAFLMAELLEMTYIKVAICAIIPAYLFFISVFFAIHFESARRNLESVPKDHIKPLGEILKPSRSITLLIPVILLITLMLQGRTPETSAFWAIAVLSMLYTFSTFKVSEIKKRLFRLVAGMDTVGRSLLKVVPLLVCANIIVSLITLTGIGVNISEIIIGLSGNHSYLALGLAAIVALMLGMGVPTPAAYLLGAAVVAPSLTTMGFEPIASHMFVLYFAILSVLTPPVCPGVYVAAGIADADWLKTAWVAIRLAIVKYILPFMFILNTSLLMLGPTSKIIWSVATATMGVYMIAAGTMGFLLENIGIVMRLILIAGSLLCFTSNAINVFIGVTLGGCVFAYQMIDRKKNRKRSGQLEI